MAQFYTLEEAARVLGMNPEDLKSEAQHRKVRAFLDGGTWRFRVGDVDELARQRGMGSDPELRLSDLELPAAQGDSVEEFDLSEYQLGVANPDLGTPTLDLPQGEPVADSTAEQDILLDDLSLPPNATASSSVIIGMQTTGSRLPSDSDVRLIPDNVTGSLAPRRPRPARRRARYVDRLQPATRSRDPPADRYPYERDGKPVSLLGPCD